MNTCDTTLRYGACEPAAASPTGTFVETAVRLVETTPATVRTWRHRIRSRRKLRTLDEHMLHDIGIDRVDAEREAAKPFWRA